MKKSSQSRAESIEAIVENMHGIRRKMMLQGDFSHDVPKVTFAQMRVLSLIVEREECSLKEISQVLEITSSAATQLVDALVEAGYVTREVSKADRRVSSVVLLPKAHTFFTTIKKKIGSKMTTLFASLTDDEVAMFATLSKKVLVGVEKKSDTINS